MSDSNLATCTFHVIRYVPNLLREEHINIGLLLHDRARNRAVARVLAEPEELARTRRLHPEADTSVLLGLTSSLLPLLTGNAPEEIEQVIEKLGETLSNAIQFGPRRAVLTENADAEFEHIYAAQVSPPAAIPYGGAARTDTRAGLRAQASEVFRRAGLLARMEHSVSMEPFTFAGDSLRLDYRYRQNGTAGYVHTVPLLRDPNQPKSIAFTAGRVRAHDDGARFHALTENEPAGDGAHFRALAAFLREQRIEVVPRNELPVFAARLQSLLP